MNELTVFWIELSISDTILVKEQQKSSTGAVRLFYFLNLIAFKIKMFDSLPCRMETEYSQKYI